MAPPTSESPPKTMSCLLAGSYAIALPVRTDGDAAGARCAQTDDVRLGVVVIAAAGAAGITTAGLGAAAADTLVTTNPPATPTAAMTTAKARRTAVPENVGRGVTPTDSTPFG
jgi:hypothetical protein